MAKSMTLGSIESFAYDRIDEYVEDEIKSWPYKLTPPILRGRCHP
jgi:hypothetical protein